MCQKAMSTMTCRRHGKSIAVVENENEGVKTFGADNRDCRHN